MGRPSNRKRSARRLGKHERARVKKKFRSSMWTFVAGVGTVHVNAGRKKFSKAIRFIRNIREEPHLSGDPIMWKVEGSTKRPVYTVEPSHPK